MAGIEDHCHLGIQDLIGEVAQEATHAGKIEVRPHLHDVEVRIAQERCDCLGIIGRIWQFAGCDIVAVANYQRNALPGLRLISSESDKDASKTYQQARNRWHEPPPMRN